MLEPYDRWHKKRPTDWERKHKQCPAHPGKVPSAEHGKGKQWAAIYYVNRKQKKEFFLTKTEAAQRLKEVYSGIGLNPKAGQQTFREWAEERIARKRVSEQTKRLYRQRLATHVYNGPNRGRRPDGQVDWTLLNLGIGDIKLRDLRKRSTFQDLFAAIDLADTSRRWLWNLVNELIELAVDDEEMNRNPMRGMQRPTFSRKEVKVWSPPTAYAVTQALPDRYRVVAEIAEIVGGARYGEAVAFSPDDVEWLSTNPHATIRRQVIRIGNQLFFSLPKNGKTRRARITTTGRDHLAARLAARPAGEVTLPWYRNPRHQADGQPADGELVTFKVFVASPSGGPVRGDVFGEAWRKAVNKVGATQRPRQRLHILRHAYASVLLANGLGVPEVARQLGDSIEVVQRTYAHYIPTYEGNEGRVWRGYASLDDFLTGAQPTGAARAEGGR